MELITLEIGGVFEMLKDVPELGLHAGDVVCMGDEFAFRTDAQEIIRSPFAPPESDLDTELDCWAEGDTELD